MDYSYIIAPIVGGVIGYITNDLAIRMLFRPHTAKYVFGIHIPFTPGIIPKEKDRIAEAIGDAISQNLMNKEVLEKYLLSDEMLGKLRVAIHEYMVSLQHNQETLSVFLSHYFQEKEIATITQGIQQSITRQTASKLSNPAVGETVAHIAIDHLSNKLGMDGAQDLLSGSGGLRGMVANLFGGNIIGKFLGMLREPAERFLANNINSMLQANGEKIISNMVDDEMSAILNKPICKILEGHDDQLRQVEQSLEAIYKSVISEQLPKILDSLDISKIVRERIQEMDVNETEKLIFQVMDKELKAIVWLGALLGMLMGTINCLI